MKPPALSSRRPSRKVHVRTVPIGGGSPISIQSMTTTHTRDAAATVEQIRRLAAAGCELVRVAVPTAADAEAIGAIVAASPIPVIADIHFKTSLAIRSLRAGAAQVRLNPGHIADPASAKVLVALLDDEDVGMAEAALAALTEMDEEELKKTGELPYAFVEGRTIKIRKKTKADWEKRLKEGYFDKKK